MNYLNLGIKFYMQHPVINTLVILGLIAIGCFLWLYKKAKVLAFVGSIKAEAINSLKGKEKLEFALKWVMKQNFYKNSILKFIPAKTIEWIINTTFNKNKSVIESK